MGIFRDNWEQDNSIIEAIQMQDTKALSSLLEDEKNLALLRADGEEEYLDWHVVRNVFPEGKEGFSRTLALGNEVLRLLAGKGFYIDGIGPDIEGWSLAALHIEDDEDKARWETPKGALWLAPSPEALKLMLAEGGDPKLTDSFGHSALYYLTEHPNDYFRPAEMVRIILEKGTYQSCDIRSALQAVLRCARYNRNAAVVFKVLADEFMKRGLTLDEDLAGTIENACRRGGLARFSAFLYEVFASMKGESKLSSSELDLMAAVLDDDLPAVDEILKRKPAPNVNVQTSKEKYTPLMFAVYCKDIKAVRRLLNAGADPNLQDEDGCSALFFVGTIHRSDAKLAELLIENGADPAFTDRRDETPFTRIFRKEELGPGDISLAYIFLNSGANVDTLNGYGHTPLQECCLRPEKDYFVYQMCKVLLEHGADANVHDLDGRTPLMYLAESPHTQLIMDLINYGADTAIEDVFGNTALSIFLDGEAKDSNILAMLTHKGAFIGSNDYDGGEGDTNGLLLKAIRDYDVEEVRRILSEEELWITLSEELCWHFVVNNVPEPEAGDFRARLSRGAEILRLLHEKDENIPVEDYKGRELSYIAATWNRFVDGYETEPDASDEVSLYRHAASPMALREIMTNDKPEEADDDDDDDDLFDEEFMARASRMFSPEDFVTRDDEATLRAKIRSSFTPDDFISSDEDKNILHILPKYPNEYYDAAGMIRTAAELGEDLRAENDYDETPFAVAVEECSALCARAFLDAGYTLDESLAGGEPAEGSTLRWMLNRPVYTDPAKFKKAVYAENGADKEVIFLEVMRTILCGKGRANDDLLAASFDGDIHTIRKALAQGADVNVRTLRGYTPLMLAVMPGHAEAVRVLLENGADIKAEDMLENGIAALADDLKILRILVENGADINKPNLDGKTPAAFAARNKNYKQVKALLKAGADPMSLKENFDE